MLVLKARSGIAIYLDPSKIEAICSESGDTTKVFVTGDADNHYVVMETPDQIAALIEAWGQRYDITGGYSSTELIYGLGLQDGAFVWHRRALA